MKKSGGVFSVPVTINGVTKDFDFDTGSSLVLLPDSVFDICGEDIIDSAIFIDAFGGTSKRKIINIREMTICSIKLFNIPAVLMNNSKCSPLLGQSALGKFNSVKIDYKKMNLILQK